MVINNNNNNGFQTDTPAQQPVSAPITTQKKTPFLFEMPKELNRSAMVKISLLLGWSGLHFFLFRRPFFAALHLFLAIIGIVGASSIFFIIFLADQNHITLLLTVATAMTIALLLSILGGVINAFYWSLKSDEDFNQAYADVINSNKK